MLLDGKTALITGAAGSLGSAQAARFAQEGARVALADVREDEAHAVAAQIRAAGGDAFVVSLDVADDGAWAAALDSVAARFGRLDVLVNNAGIDAAREPRLLELEPWDAVMAVNARGVFLGMRHALPVMRAGGGGAIVNISSIAGFVGMEGTHMGYNASKAAVRIITKSAAVQNARHGIRVNSVHPGIMPPMLGTVRSEERQQHLLTEKIPMGRFGRADEVAAGVLFLASDEASYITGTELVIDGGYLAI